MPVLTVPDYPVLPSNAWDLASLHDLALLLDLLLGGILTLLLGICGIHARQRRAPGPSLSGNNTFLTTAGLARWMCDSG